MEYQLGALAGQEVYLERELTGLGLVQDFADLGDWETRIRAFLAEVSDGLVRLERTAASEEERHEQFLFKRRIVLQLVQRVEIRMGRKLKTVFKLNVPEILSSTSK